MNSLRNDTAVYGLAQAGERLLSFFLLPLLTKSISPAEYAIWTQFVVIAGVFTPIVLLGFQTALVKFVPAWNTTPGRQDSMLRAMLLVIAGMLTVTVLGMCLAAPLTSQLAFGDAAHTSIIPLLGGLLISEALFEFLVGVLRARGLIRRIALYGLFKGFWRIALLLLLLNVMGTSFSAALTGFVLLQLMFVSVMYLREMTLGSVISGGLAPTSPPWRETLAFSLPLVPLALLTAVNNFSDRFFLIHLRGLEEVATYSAAFSLAAIASFFYSVLGFTLFPALSRHWAEGNHEQAKRLMEQAISLYLFFLLPFVAGLGMVGPSLLPMLSTTAYAASGWLFLLLGVSIGLFGLYQIALYIALLGEGSLRNLKPMLLSALTGIVMNALLVAPLGNIGAAMSICAANVVLAVITLVRAQRLLPWRFPWRAAANISARALAMLAGLAFAMHVNSDAGPIQLLAIVILAALFYVALDAFSRRDSILALLNSR